MSRNKTTILVQLDTDTQPSVFDAVVAVDAGVQQLLRHGGVTPDNVRDLVYGTIFTRGPADLNHTAIFVGGSNVSAGEAILEVIKKAFFGPFRVSVMFDGNGSNTTAAAAVLTALQASGGSLQDTRMLVLAATGPVGQRIALLLGRLGAVVAVGSRSLDRAGALAKRLHEVTGAQFIPFQMANSDGVAAELRAASIVISSGPPGSSALAGESLAELLAPRGADRSQCGAASRNRGRRGSRQEQISLGHSSLGSAGRGRYQDEHPQESHPAVVHSQRPCPGRRGSSGTGPIAWLIPSRTFPFDQDQGVLRVVGTDPGTSSLDLLLLEDGRVVDQRRFRPEELRERPGALAGLLDQWTPLTLVAGPSGYGLPLVPADRLTEDQIDQMSLVRPDHRGEPAGLIGFRSWVRALVQSGLPVVFLPGGFHLPTIPPHRKANSVDLGTADKVAVAALALWFDAAAHGGVDRSTFAVVEIGSAFTAMMVVQDGRLVNASAGTNGPIGLRSRGAWDGEVAYWNAHSPRATCFAAGSTTSARWARKPFANH